MKGKYIETPKRLENFCSLTYRSDHMNHKQNFQKMGKIVYKFKSETPGRCMVNNKQMADNNKQTIRRILSLRILCHPKETTHCNGQRH